MNLIILRVNGVLYYAHHTSNLYPGIWYKKYRSDSFLMIYNEIIEDLTIDQPVKVGTKQTLIELVDLDFWQLVKSENTNQLINQLKIAI